MDKKILEVSSYLTENVKNELKKLSLEVQKEIREIRVRANREICFVLNKGEIFFSEKKTSVQELSEIFRDMCEYSIYSFQNQIKNGFITLKGGHRVGICGTAVTSHGEIENIKNISSLNIRIAREILDCSEPVLKHIQNLKKGFLIAGPPLSGKTTILRDLARTLSKDKKVTLVDERCEIAAISNGVPGCDVGFCDVLDMYPKSEGILQATRCLSPEILICDEIGSLSETKAIIQSLNTGISIIISIHASNMDELLKKPQVKELLKTSAFEKIIFLGEENVKNFRCFTFDSLRHSGRNSRYKKHIKKN